MINTQKIIETVCLTITNKSDSPKSFKLFGHGYLAHNDGNPDGISIEYVVGYSYRQVLSASLEKKISLINVYANKEVALMLRGVGYDNIPYEKSIVAGELSGKPIGSFEYPLSDIFLSITPDGWQLQSGDSIMVTLCVEEKNKIIIICCKLFHRCHILTW